jgi:hypothetical protein
MINEPTNIEIETRMNTSLIFIAGAVPPPDILYATCIGIMKIVMQH